jgi:hypothetical protein
VPADKPAKMHPCAFCLSKNTAFCDECGERYHLVVLLEDDNENFLVARDMAHTSPTSTPFPAH